MSDLKMNLNRYYDNDSWIPHCTIGIHLPEEQLLRAVSIMKKNIMPITATFTKIGIMAFPPNKQIFETEFHNCWNDYS